MKFMLIIKSNPEIEAGAIPKPEDFEAMTKFNQEMVAAGVMLAGEGLLPSAKSAKVKFSGPRRTVIDGPFAESKELIAGFWIIETKSLEEAIDWAKRVPNSEDGESEIEIRQVATEDDFGDAMTPEVRAAEEQMRKDIAARTKKG
ncbi:MAG: YciI family protein [Bauldia sp.]